MMLSVCLHVFCQQCVAKLNEAGNIKCPNCSAICHVSLVKRDFRTVNLLDDLNKYRENKNQKEGNKKPEVELICQLCDTHTDIVSRCDVCLYLLCTTCNKSHSKLFPDHNKTNLSKFVEDVKSKIKYKQVECEQLIGNFNKILQDLKKRRLDITNKKSSAITEIENNKKEKIKKVNQYYDQLKVSLYNQTNKYEQSILEVEEKLSSKCATLNVAVSNLEDLMKAEYKNIISTFEKTIENSDKGGSKGETRSNWTKGHNKSLTIFYLCQGD
jgi:hypothetical protein